MWPRSRLRRPLLLASLTGDGSTVFSVIPSNQPGLSTRVACFRSRCAVTWKRAWYINPPRTREGANSLSDAAPVASAVVVDGRCPKTFSSPSTATIGSNVNSPRRTQISHARPSRSRSRLSTICSGMSATERSCSPFWRAKRARSALRDEADLPARLEHRPADLLERVDLLVTRLRRNLLRRQAVAPQVLVDDIAVLDQDQRLALEDRPQCPEAPRGVREEQGQHGDRPDGEAHPGHGEVVLRHPLLHEIANGHEQDQ